MESTRIAEIERAKKILPDPYEYNYNEVKIRFDDGYKKPIYFYKDKSGILKHTRQSPIIEVIFHKCIITKTNNDTEGLLEIYTGLKKDIDKNAKAKWIPKEYLFTAGEFPNPLTQQLLNEYISEP